FLGSVVTAGLAFGRAVRRWRRPPLSIAAIVAYAAGLLGFIVISYVTKRQPILFPRYGLIFFALGLPLLMWLIGLSIKASARLPKLIALTAMVLCLWDGLRQFPITGKVRADFDAQKTITETLQAAFQSSGDPTQRCFCDDVAVRVLSR